jgi:cytoskeletal protein RodZ
MSAVAELLRRGREARGLTVEQVAEITKIRTDHLRALEEGNFNVFSAPVYIRGFVRTCSTLLKLDVPKVMATLDEELGRTEKFSEPPPLSDRPRGVVDWVMLQLSRIDWRKSLIVLGVVAVAGGAVLAYFAWRHYHASEPLKNLKPGVYQPTQHVSGETLPLPAPKR